MSFQESFEIETNPQNARDRAAADFNFFAGLCIPHIMIFQFPPYYVALFNFLVSAIKYLGVIRVMRFAIGLPRGFAKTTYLKIFVVWLICHDYFSFIAVICATEPHAENFIGDVQEILSNPNITLLYGDWQKRLIIDNKGMKRCQYRGKDVILLGAGAGTSVRGLSIGNKRPQFVLCDDMEKKNDNDDDMTADPALLNWAVGTLFKFIDPFRAVICFVGNMYGTDCILYKLKEHEDWVSLITGCITESGASLWEDLHPLESLHAGFKHDERLGKADIWFAEMMNDPVTRENALLSGPLPLERFDHVIEPDSAFITIDPAGYRDGADDNVITGHYEYNKKNYIAEMDGGRWDPGVLINNTLGMCSRIGAGLIGVEDVAYQASLIYWFERIMRERKIDGITVIGLKVSQAAKEKRIRSFIKEMYANSWPFLRDSDRMKFTWQAAAFRPGKKKNKDDWLDSPALGKEVRDKHRHLLRRYKASTEESDALVMNNTPF